MRMLDRTQRADVDRSARRSRRRSPTQLRAAAAKRPTGILLVTGPTGSGKSTTLYASLMTLYRPQIRILTAEDPIEYVYEQFSQSEVNEQIGNTFASYLRAFLRHDPEVIMVGEIRDEETAEMAFRAAQTGHLLLSTLHTTTAVGACRACSTWASIPPLASSLIGVSASGWCDRSAECRVPAQPATTISCRSSSTARVADVLQGQGMRDVPLPGTRANRHRRAVDPEPAGHCPHQQGSPPRGDRCERRGQHLLHGGHRPRSSAARAHHARRAHSRGSLRSNHGLQAAQLFGSSSVARQLKLFPSSFLSGGADNICFDALPIGVQNVGGHRCVCREPSYVAGCAGSANHW